MNKYLTEFKNKDGQAYGWHIMANSLEEAQKEVDERGIGEEIISQAIIETSSALKEEVLLKASIANFKEYEDLIAQLKETLDKVNKFALKVVVE